MGKLQKTAKDPAIEAIRLAIDDAMDTAELAVHKAIRVGQLLAEYKPTIGHGNFQDFIAENFPRISYDTAHRWMQAAGNVVKQIDLGACSVPASQLLSCAAEDLPDDAAREAQQLLFDFTKDKTIKDCLAAVVVDGDEPHRITRAANGKNARQTKGEDRKDFPLFGLEKLSDLSAHLSHWKTMPETHRNDLGQIIKAAILGDAMKLAGRKKAMVHFKPWPEEFSKIALDALRERLKGK